MDWIETSAGTRISKTARLNSPQKIQIKGNCTVYNDVVIDGTVNTETPFSVSIGKYCFINSYTKITPPVLRAKDEVYSPVKIGSYVIIGSNCDIRSAGIGSRVVVEDDCVLGDLSIVYDCCIIRKGAVIPPKMVIAPFSEVSGVPGKNLMVKELPSGYKRSIEMEAKEIQVIGTRGW